MVVKMDFDAEVEELIKRKLIELDTLVNLVQNEQMDMSDELRIRYFEQIERLMLELNELKIQRTFGDLDENSLM